MHTLLVEDDKELTALLSKILKKSNFVVDTDNSGAKTLSKLQKDQHDVVVLDLNLPDVDGIELCKQIRSSGNSVPIIMLTNRSTTVDKVTGLDAGADDYLPKPFHPDELIARIRALMRRPDQVVHEEFVVADLHLNAQTLIVSRGGKTVELMPKEYQLLEFLMRKQGVVATKAELLRHVWGIYSNNTSNRLEVYIKYLRNKIDDGHDKKLIHTIRGKGYQIVER